MRDRINTSSRVRPDGSRNVYRQGVTIEEERIALFMDYENLAISAREDLGGIAFDFGPVADALAERGRVIARKAYGDWSYFDEDRRMLTRHHVELIEIPQRMGTIRKNAADIKMAVDALEMAFERSYVSTFVICTGDSDFTPLVHKLRELNKRVIGVGIRASTSKLLPPACDEFLFYETLEGVEPGVPTPKKPARQQAPPIPEVIAPEPKDTPADNDGKSLDDLAKLVSTTVGGLKRSAGGIILGSQLKRTLLRKDPTFSEANYGFRAFGELLRYLDEQGVIELSEGPAKGDPEIDFPTESAGADAAFDLVKKIISEIGTDRTVMLSGLKDQMRKRDPQFSEKQFGYSSFLQFMKAAETKGVVRLEWNEELGGYILGV